MRDLLEFPPIWARVMGYMLWAVAWAALLYAILRGWMPHQFYPDGVGL